MTREELIENIDKYRLSIPVSDDFSVLKKPARVKDTGVTLKNSLATHPMEGMDGLPDGSPGEVTFRRYSRLAGSGAGLIWFEATAVAEDGRSSPRQLMLAENNVSEFSRLTETIHQKSGGAPVILQLTHSGRFSKPRGKPEPVITYHNPVLNRSFDIPADYTTASDDYLDRLGERFVQVSRLACKAGFDGVDIKACHRYLLGEILSAYTRPGKNGGSYENRTALLRSIVRSARSALPSSMAVGSRLGVFDAIDYPYGFGVDRDDYTKPDTAEPMRLIGELFDDGLRLINFTMGTPYFNPHINRPYNSGSYLPPEHPLAGVDRLIKYAGIFQKAYPDITFVGTGYSYLGAASPYAAAGAVKQGLISAAGFGRMAIAYGTFARDILDGKFDSKKVCLACGKCSALMRAGGMSGCPVRDGEFYMPIYRQYCMKDKQGGE